MDCIAVKYQKDKVVTAKSLIRKVLGFFNKFIYFWLCWVFLAVRGLLIAVASLVAEHGL